MTDPDRWSTPADLEAQLTRLWTQGRLLRALVHPGAQEGVQFPLALRLARPDRADLGQQFEAVRDFIRALEAGAKPARGFGYELVFEEVNHRQLGRNRIPRSALVPTFDDALALLGKRRAAERFERLWRATLARFPELEGWLCDHSLLALEHEAAWEQVLSILDWFRAHPRPGLYLRQLEIPGIDTKFIEVRKGLLAQLLDRVLAAGAIDVAASGARQFEARYGLLSKPPLVRFRVLDEGLQLGPLSDIATPPAQFAQLSLPVERVFITENDINGLAFPAMPRSIVIFGLGYGVDRLGEIGWLHGPELHYWGDIDTHGFAILNRLRVSFPAARSLLMDRTTLSVHQPLWSREAERHLGSFERLDDEERELCADLQQDRLGESVRLEQERIGYAWLKQALRSL